MTPNLRRLTFAFISNRLGASLTAALVSVGISIALPINIEAAGRPALVKVKSIPFSFSVLNRGRTEFGKLKWRGGIELLSPHEDFGGLSGIAVETDGSKFIAVSDTGTWVTGNIHYVANTLSSISNVKISPLLDRRGRPFSRKRHFDAESVAPFGKKGLRGKLLVAFERKQRVGRYDFGKKGVRAREKTIKLPREAKEAKHNKELESVGRFPKGSPYLEKTVIAISERFLDINGNVIGWLIGGRTPGRFSIKRLNDFDITDLTITPDNELIILERYFSTMSGVEMRLRKIDVSKLKPGALLEGEILLETDQRLTIDNMEGLASHRNAEGETIITLISDNNFNTFQRTLLMQFALKK